MLGYTALLDSEQNFFSILSLVGKQVASNDIVLSILGS